jgi:hypothetical protein
LPTASASEAPRLSAALCRLAETHPGPRVLLADLADALGEHGFGLLILLLALPNAIPGPAVPGLSTITGLPLTLLALQLACGWTRPRLPGAVMRRSIPLESFRRWVERAAPRLRRLERHFGRRPSPLTTPAGHRSIGAALVVLGFVLSLPVPLGNLPAAVSIMVLALGLLEEDSRALLAGLGAGALSCFWVGVLLVAGMEIVHAVAALW